MFQVIKHAVEFHADDSRHVLTKHPSGFCICNNAEHFRPERTVIARASALPGCAEWLARKSACDQIGMDASDVFDVSVVGHGGPVAFEDFARIRFDFRKADGCESRRLRGKREAADAGKEIKVSKTDT
jgi:hypothetical protein